MKSTEKERLLAWMHKKFDNDVQGHLFAERMLGHSIPFADNDMWAFLIALVESVEVEDDNI